MGFRKDIEGLRVIAVIAVFFYHAGYLPNGYLGVDVFFVISGFLITSQLYRSAQSGNLSLTKFYERRIRRIYPLLLIVTLSAFVFGVLYMLPDDLENLSQSVIASNLSANNILLYIKNGNYWQKFNDYKLLIHTWSLGVEVQFYAIFPLMFLFLKGKKLDYMPSILLVLAGVSLCAFGFSANRVLAFYSLPFRLFQFFIGGYAALVPLSGFKKSYREGLALVCLVGLIAVFALPTTSELAFPVAVSALTGLLLWLKGDGYLQSSFSDKLLSNSIFGYIGKISFGLYLWHQVVIAIARYSFVEQITGLHVLFFFTISFGLASITYYLIEKPFRNPLFISVKKLFVGLGLLASLSSIGAVYLYSIGGVYKDFPCLNLYRKDNATRHNSIFNAAYNVHIKYNETVRQYDRPFDSSNKIKVLVVGNSQGRDFANIILESSCADSIQLRYFDVTKIYDDSSFVHRAKQADIIFLPASKNTNPLWLQNLKASNNGSGIPKLIWFGPKNFGSSNGLHYRAFSNGLDFSTYRTPVRPSVVVRNNQWRRYWRSSYIDVLGVLTDENGNVLVFTLDGKFISQDTVHLTKEGAVFLAKLLNDQLRMLLLLK